jgi:sterol desaturase/sphingolipid hydroxylase (fatty acid hydroxylase superfamily)
MTAGALIEAEGTIRLAVFLSVLALMALWELAAPKRRLDIPRLVRWSNNLALVAIDTVLVRLLFPVLATGVAIWAEARGFGLIHLAGLGGTAAFVLGFLALDLAIWAQHRIFHAVPVLWRLHRMHHADLDFDVTTGLRFHPGEIILSMLVKMGIVALLGVPPLAVLAFEVVLNSTSLFNHGNVRLPARLEAILRLLVVTPDMHRVHHSAIPEETNSNFGFNLPWWDRLFGTYRRTPRLGHDGMTIGLNRFRDPSELRLDRMLLQPFRGREGPD